MVAPLLKIKMYSLIRCAQMQISIRKYEWIWSYYTNNRQFKMTVEWVRGKRPFKAESTQKYTVSVVFVCCIVSHEQLCCHKHAQTCWNSLLYKELTECFQHVRGFYSKMYLIHIFVQACSLVLCNNSQFWDTRPLLEYFFDFDNFSYCLETQIINTKQKSTKTLWQ